MQISPSVQSIRDALSPFGALRPQSAGDWTGEVPLHPSLARFYAEVGPYGVEGPGGPEGLDIPSPGNPFRLPALPRLWDLQAGYRWDARDGRRLPRWRDEWLVVADAGGDPFILDLVTGAVLHDRHGGGAWSPEPIFPDILAMAAALATVGALLDEAGEDLYDETFEIRPEWRTRLAERLAPFTGDVDATEVVERLGM